MCPIDADLSDIQPWFFETSNADDTGGHAEGDFQLGPGGADPLTAGSSHQHWPQGQQFVAQTPHTYTSSQTNKPVRRTHGGGGYFAGSHQGSAAYASHPAHPSQNVVQHSPSNSGAVAYPGGNYPMTRISHRPPPVNSGFPPMPPPPEPLSFSLSTASAIYINSLPFGYIWNPIGRLADEGRSQAFTRHLNQHQHANYTVREVEKHLEPSFQSLIAAYGETLPVGYSKSLPQLLQDALETLRSPRSDSNDRNYRGPAESDSSSSDAQSRVGGESGSQLGPIRTARRNADHYDPLADRYQATARGANQDVPFNFEFDSMALGRQPMARRETRGFSPKPPSQTYPDKGASMGPAPNLTTSDLEDLAKETYNNKAGIIDFRAAVQQRDVLRKISTETVDLIFKRVAHKIRGDAQAARELGNGKLRYDLIAKRIEEMPEPPDGSLIVENGQEKLSTEAVEYVHRMETKHARTKIARKLAKSVGREHHTIHELVQKVPKQT